MVHVNKYFSSSRKSRAPNLMLAMLTFSMLTSAAVVRAERWYVGTGVGEAVAPDDFTGADLRAEDVKAAGTLFAGYEFTRHVAIEVGIANTGEFKAKGSFAGQPATHRLE